jgi:hypothetical protein
MKTKTVTIYNWDGSKYDVEAPVNAKYLGIFSHIGVIFFYSRKPKLGTDGYYHGANIENACARCPSRENYPCEDGYGQDGLVLVKGVRMSELLLRIEE